MTRRRFGVWACVAVLSLGACSTSPSTTTEVVETTSTVPAYWQPCGDIECAEVEVPVDYSSPDGATMSLAVYRRVGTQNPAAAPVIMVPDSRWGDNARELLELAPSHLGSAWTAQTLISISRRGSDASPMPGGSEHLVSTRDVARDIEVVRDSLNLDAITAMGWGTGATALAVLAMENPSSLSSMVLDSPVHPSMSAQDRASSQIAANNAVVEEAMRWCVSHISCPLQANFAREFNLFRTNTRLGIVDPAVNSVVVARAARNAFAIGDPQAFFTGITQATVGDATALLTTAGEGAVPSEVHAVCADETLGGAQQMAQQLASNHADVSRFFSLGDDHLVYAQCAQLPEAVHPLEGLSSHSETNKVKSLVIVAENNPVVAGSMSAALAQQFSWKTYAVPLWRHLVVGYDDTATQRALEFLLS
jgi:pimeloyl-ACP methyl ester carboxylesterase